MRGVRSSARGRIDWLSRDQSRLRNQLFFVPPRLLANIFLSVLRTSRVSNSCPFTLELFDGGIENRFVSERSRYHVGCCTASNGAVAQGECGIGSSH